jgi:16S rRNA (guanine1207-N2)-methyltransferase
MPDRETHDHYFAPQPTSASDAREIVVALHDREFVFATDAGVFSHRFLDRGTRLLIEHLPLPLTGEVLDWGAGYGPIGVAVAALSPAARVLMVEINARAADLARRNAERNRAGSAEVVCGDAFEALGERRFDVVLTNPPIHAGKPVVMALIEDARGRLREGGELWMVVRTRDGARSYHARLAALFPDVQRVAMRGGYRVLRASRG